MRKMRWLERNGFHAITQVQLFDALEHGAPLPKRPVMITFDDGYTDVLWNAAPILARLRFPATAYVITGRVSGSDPSFLTWEELRALERHGIAIGSAHGRPSRANGPLRCGGAVSAGCIPAGA